MSKRLILFGLVLVLLSSLCLAEISQSDIIHAWECENDFTDATGNYTLTNSGFAFDGAEKKLGSYSCDGRGSATDYLLTNFNDYDLNHAISLWMYIDAWSATNYASFVSTDTSDALGAMNTDYGMYMHAAGTPYWMNAVAMGTSQGLGSWSHIVLTYDGTAVRYYLNGNLEGTTTTNLPTKDHFIIFGEWDNAGKGRGLDGWFDEIMILSKNITEAEVTDLYNSGAGKTYADYGSGYSGLIVIDSTSPETNTQFSQDTININITLNATTTPIFNCTLLLNDIINETWTDQVNTTTFLNVNVTFASDTNNTYYFNCTDGVTPVTSTPKYFYIDYTSPTISTAFINNLLYFESNVTGQFNLSDSFLLYSYNATLNGATISNASNMGVSDYSYNFSYDPTLLTVGTQNLSIRLADGHTSKEIPDYKITDGLFNNVLKYTFPDGNYIQIEKKSKSIFDKFETKKNKDRYTFDFNPSDKQKNTYNFIITSSQPIDIIETDSKYKNYIISGINWLDFVSPDDLNSNVQIDYIDPYSVDVTVSGLKAKDKYQFNSIGELNIVTYNYTFDVGNYSFSYSSPSFEGEAVDYNLTVLAPNVTGVYANFYYNNTLYTLNSTETGSSYRTFVSTIITPFFSNKSEVTPMFWEINNSDVLFNTSIYNQTYNPSELEVFVYDSGTYLLINSTNLELSSLEYLNTSVTTNGTFYFDNLKAGEYTAKFTSSGYSPRTYLVTVGDGTTQTLNAYLTNSTSSTIITITDIDSGAVLPEVSAIMYKYINLSWVPVESKYSDVTGKVKFYYEPTTKYKFYFSKVGYEDNIFYLDPVLYSTYSISMTGASLLDYSQDFDGISYVYAPSTFKNNTVTNFSILIASPTGSLISYGFNISFPGGSYADSGVNALGEQLTGLVNVTGANIFDVVTLNYYYESTNSGLREYTVLLPITFGNSTDHTFLSNNDNTFGLTAFERIFIITIIVLIVVGISAIIGAIIPGLFLGLFIFAYCVFIGFIPIWSILPTMFVGFFYLVWKSGG